MSGRNSGREARPTLLGSAFGRTGPLVVFVLFVILWHAAVVLLKIPAYEVPSPLQVIRVAGARGTDLLRATGLTGAASLLGFLSSLLVGCLIAFLFSQSALIRRSFFPYAIFLQTVPIVAIAPLIILWFGEGFRSVVLVSFLISLFPIIANGTAGLTSVDRGLAELFQVLRATRGQTLLRLRLPNALPALATGAKTSAGLSVVGAIVGEFFAGFGTKNFGLGYLILLTKNQFKTDLLFAAIIASALLGLALFATVSFLADRVLLRWRDVR